ncbi:MET13 protein, partial [Columbina picui]|nr:MET13 protein [Columbina picui]
KVDKMFAEISRVLQVGGRYLCVSLAQAHVLRKAVEYFSQEGWVVRVHQVAGSGDKQQFVLPVFVYVMTKFRKIPGSALQILEICPEEQDKPMRMESAERLVAAVKDRQHYALLCSQLSKMPCGEQVSLDLCDKESGRPRYTLHVVDSSSVKPSRDNHFAIFINLAQSLLAEWMPIWQQRDAACPASKVLIPAARGAGDSLSSSCCIKPECSRHSQKGVAGLRWHRDFPGLCFAFALAPCGGAPGSASSSIPSLQSIPVLCLVLPTSASCHSGQRKRRKDKKKPSPAEPPAAIDKSYLCCEHHKAMVAGLCLLGGPDPLPGTPLAVLVVGLGGGSLPLFVHDYFLQARVAVVEIDASMLEVATCWFGFSQGDRMQVHISDGLDYVAKLAAEVSALPPAAPAQYDAIMFDVDSKDLTVGMSCPPPAFVEKPFLQKVKTILKPEG